jgi:hypothetical protein
MWLKFAKRRILEAQGLGPPGGAYVQGFSLSSRYGGPRWWPFSRDSNLDDFIRTQTRYHPEYIPIGDAALPKDEGWELITTVKELLYGKDPEQINIIPAQDGDSKEEAVLILIDPNTDEFRVEHLPLKSDNIVKELKNWQFNISFDGNEYNIFGRKINIEGDERGIFDLNGENPTPGWRLWVKSTPSPTPGDKAHGDLSDFEWNTWRLNGGQPGK